MNGRQIFDVIGIGFGPSNLALAIALEEQEETGNITLMALFLDSKPAFSWHPGMMLPGATMQICFLKDLVTLRNPQSKYTFLNYLKTKERLNDFINLTEWYPTRQEMEDYYAWVARQFEERVCYGQEVLDVKPIWSSERNHVELLQVVAKDIKLNQISEYLTRNLVVATGGIPSILRGVKLSERVFHSGSFLPMLTTYYPDTNLPYRFVVTGGGQSAAEILDYLISTYPHAHVTSVFRTNALRAADDSGIVNRAYDTAAVDAFYKLPPDMRSASLASVKGTNYAAVDRDLIQVLVKALYADKVSGRNRLYLRANTELDNVTEHEAGISVHVKSLQGGPDEILEADAVVMATGYLRPRRHPLLETLTSYFIEDGTGFAVDRRYSIRTQPIFRPQVFLQGFAEHTHGISDTVLSILPQRASEILSAIMGTTSVATTKTMEHAV